MFRISSRARIFFPLQLCQPGSFGIACRFDSPVPRECLHQILEFRKNFELPILRGRDSMAAPEEKRVSEAKLSDLYTIANKFIIRRTNELLTKYLPVKYDHVVFCNLTPFQRDVYLQFVKSKLVKNILQGGNSCQPLKAITSLKKLCNHPSLVELKETLGPNFAQLISVPPKYNPKVCLLPPNFRPANQSIQAKCCS